jgi:hypothetical protein
MANTTGANNTGIGYSALASNSTGSFNTAVGSGAAQGLTASQTGGTYVGYLAGNNIRDNADFNTFIGYRAGSIITTGYGNIMLGANADNVSNLSSGANNIGIGYNALFPNGASNNQLSIGGLLFGTLPATTSAAALRLPTTGSLGLGTTSPFAKFSIATNNGDTATTLFAIGSSTSGATTTLFSIANTGVLTSNASATSTFSAGLNVAGLNITGSATSTAANGINLAAGCFAINGTCIGGGGGGTNYFTNSGASTYLSTGSKLGIGTTSPFATLSVAAAVKCNAVCDRIVFRRQYFLGH